MIVLPPYGVGGRPHVSSQRAVSRQGVARRKLTARPPSDRSRPGGLEEGGEWMKWCVEEEREIMCGSKKVLACHPC
jgi:hypothetical protein